MVPSETQTPLMEGENTRDWPKEVTPESHLAAPPSSTQPPGEVAQTPPEVSA